MVGRVRENPFGLPRRRDSIIPDLEVRTFVESFTALLYNARVAECLPAMLHSSATFMLRGIMTESGIGLFDNILRKNQVIS